MNFVTLQNLVLKRMRLPGVNFVGPSLTPTNATTSYDSPTEVQVLLNQGYQEFISRTLEYAIVTVKLPFTFPQGLRRIPLTPLPTWTGMVGPGSPVVYNPAVMRIREFTYYYGSSGSADPTSLTEYDVPLISTVRFKGMSGGYVWRRGSTGSRPYYAAQLNGDEHFLDVYPVASAVGDTATMTIVPDISATSDAFAGNPLVMPTCSNGGPMTLPFDVPLMPGQFHMALVDYAIMILSDGRDKPEMQAAAEKRWEGYIAQALEYGSTRNVGDPEQRVMERYSSENWRP